ncbi:hypothetical protein ISN45_Aa03g023080 [Arabidopsis thaliana x Arabidopsis arenosa]|uniref:Retrovirus-related Pol polyprotein from transposon TNT 1-94-like beta-barrel domain-containing protein n=1 Tax=Arabidopsis thaliana x Arabidopsis arenosa TaxID=1240361 RepID=A0A8T2AW74_9BRAS|nr:hypothetical protein ISN45_Aa03g023080 [Arabidopsis thaliana x Arabidopsis arenosa]
MAAANKQQDDVFDDLNYEIWARIAKTTLTEKGLWDVVENGVPPDPSKIPELGATIQPEEISKWRDLAVKDMKALQILQSSLTDSAFRKTLSASSAKVLWDLLEKGNNEQAKLRRLEKQFEELTMDEAEPTNSYLDKVIEIAEQLRRLKNGKSDYQVVTKVLGSLSESHEDLATLLEERSDLKKMTLKSLAVVFNRYESLKRESQSRNPNELPVYEMNSVTLAHETFDEDMWTISSGTTNHMTPYLKFFTTLDRTHRARVKLINGSFIMAEGRGDVKIMTKEGKKKTIKNVLFVPDLYRNVLSLGQLGQLGYMMITSGNKCILKGEKTGKVFGETVTDGRGYFMRYQVIEGNLTS